MSDLSCLQPLHNMVSTGALVAKDRQTQTVFMSPVVSSFFEENIPHLAVF